MVQLISEIRKLDREVCMISVDNIYCLCTVQQEKFFSNGLCLSDFNFYYFLFQSIEILNTITAIQKVLEMFKTMDADDNIILLDIDEDKIYKKVSNISINFFLQNFSNIKFSKNFFSVVRYIAKSNIQSRSCIVR